MDIRRLILFMALACIGYSLMNAWNTDYSVKNRVILTDQAHTSIPLSPEQESVINTQINTQQAQIKNLPAIQVKTDTLNLKIDLKSGDIIQADLLNYPVSESEKNEPFHLLTDDFNHRYVAQSNLFTIHANSVFPVDLNFQSTKSLYEMQPEQKKLSITLTGKDKSGLTVNKIFTFTQGQYLIDIEYQLSNDTQEPWQGYLNTQLVRQSPLEDKSSPFNIGSYTGASYSQPGVHRYKKLTFKEMNQENLDKTADGGWVAMQQRYFLTAWIPYPNTKNRFYSRANHDEYIIGSVGQAVTIEPVQQQLIRTRLYVGPEVAENLKAVAPGLDLTIDYGWLWLISSLLFSLMRIIYEYIGNWGWVIVIVTALIKLAFYRLSATSYRSMAAMRKLQPKMQALRERYGDDKAKMSQATMELYRQEKVNPLAGCLPILIQIPVMIALYWVLVESVEFRLAPFIFWITDLASPDPWHVLPILMGITMLIQQRLNPAPPDPMQAKVMMFLPVLFTGLFWNFPSGLVLYWTVSNTLTILQQWYITHKYDDKKPKQKLMQKLTVV